MQTESDVYGGKSAAAVAARLELVRAVLGLQQKEFARRAGINPTTYGMIKKGKSYPSIANAHALCEAFNLDFNWLFLGDPSSLRYDLANALHATHELQSRRT